MTFDIFSSGEFKIPDYNLSWLRKQVEALSKKGEKLGCDPILVIIHDTEVVEHENGTASVFYKVSIDGKIPKLNGWAFMARLDPLWTDKGEFKGNVIRAKPGMESKYLYTTYSAAAPHCEHCNKKRKRFDTFIMYKSEDCEYRQVGSKCLEDFTGLKNPKSFAKYAESIMNLGKLIEQAEKEDEDAEHVSHKRDAFRRENHWSVNWLLKQAITIVAEHGFVSTKMGYGSTANRLAEAVWNDEHEEHIRVFPKHIEAKAEGIVKWLKELENPTGFLQNAKTIAEAGFCNGRCFSIIAALPFAYDKANGVKSEYMLTREKATATFSHAPKERVKGFDAKLVDVHIWYDIDRYSYSRHEVEKAVYNFLTDEGEPLIWYASHNAGLIKGKKYTLDATVKEIEAPSKGIFKGLNCAILLRVKAKETV